MNEEIEKKPRPLKGKTEIFMKEGYVDGGRFSGNFYVYLPSKVKSAVEGLINDLEAERVEVFSDMECSYDILYDDNGEFVKFEN